MKAEQPVQMALAVMFQPGKLLHRKFSLLYGNQAALRDLRLPLEQVDAALHHAICETLQTTSTAQELVEKLDRLFLHRLFLHPLPDAAVSAANRLIHADGLEREPEVAQSSLVAVEQRKQPSGEEFHEDLIIARRTPTAENGEIVVALIDDEATVKRFYTPGWSRPIPVRRSAHFHR